MAGFYKTTVGELQDFHRVLAEQAKLTREEVGTVRMFPEFTAWFAGHIRNLMKDIVLYQGPCDRWQVDGKELYVSFVRQDKSQSARVIQRDGLDVFFLPPADENWQIDGGALYLEKPSATASGQINVMAYRLHGKSEAVYNGLKVWWTAVGGRIYYRDDKNRLRRVGDEKPLFDGKPIDDSGVDGQLVVACFNDNSTKKLVNIQGETLYESAEYFDWSIGHDGIHVLHGTKVSLVRRGKAVLVHEFPAWFLTKINGNIVDWYVAGDRAYVYDPVVGLWCNKRQILPPNSLSREWCVTEDGIYVEWEAGDETLIVKIPQPE